MSGSRITSLEAGKCSELMDYTAITFLAQWHPLIVPRRNDMRVGHEL